LRISKFDIEPLKIEPIMTKKILNLASCILLASCLSCSKDKTEAPKDKTPTEYSIKEGTGNFTYTDYQPLADKPVKVLYYNPGEKTSKVLIVMHGNSRGAQSYFNSMKTYAEKHKFMLIVPEFTEALYSSRLYHRGGILTSSDVVRTSENWTFSIIEPLFDYVKKNSGNTSSDYMLYGFSAGCQFVHRFMVFVPENRVSTFVAASAGSYTLPDYLNNYPYGLKNVSSIAPQANLNKSYAKKGYIIVGAKDNDPNGADVPTGGGDMAQGKHRVERTEFYFNQSKAMATRQNVPFNWTYKVIPNVAHEQAKMAGPVAELLFEK
jgi:hypothetical protein